MGAVDEEPDGGIDEEIARAWEGGGIDDFVSAGGEGSFGGEISFPGGDIDRFADVAEFDDEGGFEGGGLFDLKAVLDEHFSGESDDREVAPESDDLEIDGEGITGTGLGG